ncbi:transmembrane protein, putative [Rhizoctonia solani AG-3 Rhs1AP]|uniref:Transmembrane protein, putative n=1 Tax=Rhizoctonia solani AG-3 Rhs1AP TaxID=1086054 RepID=X8JRT0_9AGAM|nr:transmembrane protein, putative [Rhizoctonia solani AG-3 Rhs1AP]
MDGVNCDCLFELNPDITGIGVRVALYVQILIGWFMSLIWPDTFVENSRVAYMTALALLIASFIELTTQTLNLLDAIVVSFITTMMITFAIASYARLPAPGGEDQDAKPGEQSADEKSSLTRWFMQFCFVIFWGAWCFNMWRDPAHFGLKDTAAACDTNYNIKIQLFTQVHATDPNVRIAALTLVAIGFAIAVLSLFVTLEQFLLPIFWLMGRDKDSTAREIRKKYENNPVLQSVHLVFQTMAVGTFIFLIYAAEKTIALNDVDGTTRDWTYGQTIALILLLQQIMQLFSTHIEQREKAELEQEKEATKNGDVPYPGIELRSQPPNPNAPNLPPAPLS